MPIKEITVFTNGDSRRLDTWSNVPFFFTDTLTSKGIKVNTVDISPNPLLNKIYQIFFFSILKLIFKNTTYDYFRSLAHFYDVRRRIKIAIKKHPHSEANIFLTFSFSSIGLANKPTILLCDWTYEYYLKYFENRKPDFFEKKSIKRENFQIEGSDLVFPFFPSVSDYMRKHYKNNNISYIGCFINSLYKVSKNEIIKKKESSFDLLFVGRPTYIEGARSLMKAFEKLKDVYPQLQLHIIGITDKDLKNTSKDIHCYGYLNKGKDTDRELYYDLFTRAKIFINTPPRWGSIAATIEAMYFCTPVIVTPFEEFVKKFGTEIEFGHYCKHNTPANIEEKILNILNSRCYDSLCANSHDSVKEYTWSRYIDKVILRIEEKLMVPN